jgi:two-component system, NarL family, sensor kinase
VLPFALSGLLALLLVGAGLLLVVRHQGVKESVRDARRVTRVLATTAIEPALDDGILRSTPASVARMDRIVRGRVLRDPVVRVKIWAPDGRIVYSDQPQLIGTTYPLGADERAAFRQNTVEAELSDLNRPENRFERQFGKLLEVYLPVRTKSGRPLLFEAYQRYSSVAAGGRRQWLAFLPALIIALVVLWLVQIPLAFSLARRLQARQREREGLLVRAIEASDVERRRIAADLHDGAVQDLAGISFSLDAAAGRVDSTPVGEIRNLLRRGARVTRETMRQLRSLLVEIYPPNLHNAGLEPAINDLLAPLRRRGLETELDMDGIERLEPESEQLVFRTVQEALRNVADHAHASRVVVSVERSGGAVLTRIEDDGIGFDPAAAAARTREGHFGLSLLADRARDLGGNLEIEAAAGRGAVVTLEVRDQ